MYPVSTQLHSAEDWEFVSAAPKVLTKSARRIRVGSNGNLYLVPLNTNAEKLVGPVLAGEYVEVQFSAIGPSTTCTDMTVYY